MKGGKQSPERLKGQSLNYQHLQLQNLLPRPWLQQCPRLHGLCGISWDFAGLWTDHSCHSRNPFGCSRKGNRKFPACFGGIAVEAGHVRPLSLLVTALLLGTLLHQPMNQDLHMWDPSMHRYPRPQGSCATTPRHLPGTQSNWKPQLCKHCTYPKSQGVKTEDYFFTKDQQNQQTTTFIYR